MTPMLKYERLINCRTPLWPLATRLPELAPLASFSCKSFMCHTRRRIFICQRRSSISYQAAIWDFWTNVSKPALADITYDNHSGLLSDD